MGISDDAVPPEIVGIAKIEIICPFRKEAAIYQIDDLKAFRHL